MAFQKRTGTITNILCEYGSKADESRKRYENEVKYNNTIFQTTIADTKNNEAYKLHLENLQLYRKLAFTKLDTAIKEAVAKEKEKALMPLSEDESIYLQTMTHTKNVTLEDFKAMAEKYQNNYIAMKMLDTIAMNNDIVFSYIHLDLKIQKADEVKQFATGVINGYGTSKTVSGFDLRSSMALEGLLEYDMDIVTGPYITDFNFEKRH